jgi:hypothetical protein
VALEAYLPRVGELLTSETSISKKSVDGLIRFSAAMGIVSGPTPFERIVAADFRKPAS